MFHAATILHVLRKSNTRKNILSREKRLQACSRSIVFLNKQISSIFYSRHVAARAWTHVYATEQNNATDVLGSEVKKWNNTPCLDAAVNIRSKVFEMAGVMLYFV